jgi:hypothetical protein
VVYYIVYSWRKRARETSVADPFPRHIPVAGECVLLIGFKLCQIFQVENKDADANSVKMMVAVDFLVVRSSDSMFRSVPG